MALALVAWRVRIISSVMTLPGVKAEGLTPYSSDTA
jgi:hypothetical protein